MMIENTIKIALAAFLASICNLSMAGPLASVIDVLTQSANLSSGLSGIANLNAPPIESLVALGGLSDLGGGFSGLTVLPVDIISLSGSEGSDQPSIVLPFNPLPLTIETVGRLPALDTVPGTPVILLFLDILALSPL
ncbi:hypothetical protein [Zhongshania arctica]|uniref:Uncharacterized protein n=1 Tax=Zhongshania arctica TaxID=3238302 RepID=A0ABV3TU86_9GAMM